MTDREIMQQALTVLKAWDAVAWRTLDTIEGLEAALAQPEQNISYTDIQMAELIMSDCGHSSDYTPLLNRIAGRLATYRQALAQPEQSKYSDIVSDGGLDPRNKFDAQPEQTPVAWKYDWYGHKSEKEPRALVKDWIASVYSEVSDPTINAHNIRPLYAAPPKREWVGLTDDEIDQIAAEVCFGYIDVARAIEAKLKEKNT